MLLRACVTSSSILKIEKKARLQNGKKKVNESMTKKFRKKPAKFWRKKRFGNFNLNSKKYGKGLLTVFDQLLQIKFSQPPKISL